MEWLEEHSQVITAIANICTLFVWLFYAQLLYYNFARQRQPRIIVNRGKGTGTQALCLVSNMSSEAIYVQHVIAVLHTEERTYELDVVEHQKESEEEDDDGNTFRTHQGPLRSGDYIHLQSFGKIVEGLKAYWEIDEQVLTRKELHLEIRVVAIYGPEDMPVGASRVFKLTLDAEPNRQLIPAKIDTQRMSSRRERKQVLEWAKSIENHKA